MRDLHDDERDERRIVLAPDAFDFDAHVASAEANADAAQLAESLSQIIGGQHQVMAGFRRLETLLAERTRADSQHVAALSKLVVKPDDLWRASHEGARQGAEGAFHQAIQRIAVAIQRVNAVEDRLITDSQERRDERGRWLQAGLSAVAAILVLGAASGWATWRAGEAIGFARAREESAAASWANTAPGQFARGLSEAGKLEQMRLCNADGWQIQKSNGRRACIPIGSGGVVTGWYLP